MSKWQVQEAKSRLSEVMDRAFSDGPQIITKYGKEYAVVMSAEEYHRLSAPKRSLADLLLSGPKFDDFELPPRQIDPPRDLNWDDDGGDVAAE